ncbi:hypothetical protein Ddc_19721 [Ditylenchus destructor]|nr:hypothetical protein Ddc_19721 [Ditylenchus destructor]
MNALILLMLAMAACIAYLSWRLAQQSRRHHRAKRRAERLARVLLTLSRANRMVLRIDDERELFSEACRICIDAGHAMLATVYLKQDHLAHRVASAGPAAEVLRRVPDPLDLSDPAFQGTYTAGVLREGVSAVSNDYGLDARAGRWRTEAVAEGIRSIAWIPVRRGEATVRRADDLRRRARLLRRRAAGAAGGTGGGPVLCARRHRRSPRARSGRTRGRGDPARELVGRGIAGIPSPRVLGLAHALRLVDAGVAGGQIAHHAGQAGEDADRRAEELHRHQRAGQRRVGRAGKHRHEADTGHHRERHVQERRQRIAQRGADIEQRRDFAALEARAQRGHRQAGLGQELPGRGGLLEGLDDGRDAQSGKAPGAAEPDQRRDRETADQRSQRRIRDAPLHEAGGRMRRAREGHADQPEHDAGDQHRAQRPGGDRRDRARRVMDVMHAPQRGDLVGHDGGDHAGQQRVVAQAADGEHLQPEDGARERRAEHRGEARADAGHQQDAAVLGAQLEDVGELVRQRAAHLHGGAFAPDRRAKQVRHDRAAQHQRHHAQRHDLLGVVDLVDDEVVAGIHAAADLQIEPAHREARQRQAPDQPAMALAGLRGPVQREQEHGGGRAGQRRDHAGQRQPAPEVGQQGEGSWEWLKRGGFIEDPGCRAAHLVDEGSRRTPTKPRSPRTS